MPSIQSIFKFSTALQTTVSDLLDLDSTPRPDAAARELAAVLRGATPKHARTVLETAKLIMGLPGAREKASRSRSSAT